MDQSQLAEEGVAEEGGNELVARYQNSKQGDEPTTDRLQYSTQHATRSVSCERLS